MGVSDEAIFLHRRGVHEAGGAKRDGLSVGTCVAKVRPAGRAPLMFRGRHGWVWKCLLVLSAVRLAMTGAASAGQLYNVSFHADFDTGFGGLPFVEMRGAYVFEVLPPAYLTDENASAHYETSFRSGSFSLSGLEFDGTEGYLRVDNNVRMASSTYRDGYYALTFLSGVLASRFSLGAAGLSFEQLGTAPSALTSCDLPTSAADLAGFGDSSTRYAVLSFQNLPDGVWYSSTAPVDSLQFTAIPEPGVWSFVAMNALALALRICPGSVFRRCA